MYTNIQFLPISDEEFNSMDIDFIRNDVLAQDSIDTLAKGIAVDIFRNGPVEDMHSAGQLSQDDMKKLNKYMVDRLARFLTSIKAGKWNKLFAELSFNYLYAKDWDKANPERSNYSTDKEFIQ